MQCSSFTTWHKSAHKEIQGQLRIKLISRSGWRDTVKFYLSNQRNCLPCDFILEVSVGPVADLKQGRKGSVDPKITTHMCSDFIFKLGTLRVFYILEYSCLLEVPRKFLAAQI